MRRWTFAVLALVLLAGGTQALVGSQNAIAGGGSPDITFSVNPPEDQTCVNPGVGGIPARTTELSLAFEEGTDPACFVLPKDQSLVLYLTELGTTCREGAFLGVDLETDVFVVVDPLGTGFISLVPDKLGPQQMDLLHDTVIDPRGFGELHKMVAHPDWWHVAVDLEYTPWVPVLDVLNAGLPC